MSTTSNVKKTILYVERSAFEGDKRLWGSMTSLSGLLQHLNREKYEAKLVVSFENDVFTELKMQGVGLVHVSSGEGKVGAPPMESRLRESTPGRYLRRSFLNRLRRAVRNFLLRTLPDAMTFYKVVRKQNPDLIHCNNGLKINFGFVIAAMLARKKCICHERGMFEFNRVEKLIGRSVALFICNSNAVKEHHARQGFGGEKIEVVHNGIDLVRFSPRKPEREKSREVSIVSVGRLIEWKGHQILIKAVPKVLQRYPSAKFTIVGSGKYEDQLKALSGSLEVDGSLIYAGYLSDVRATMAECTIFVHCSIAPEPFGRTVIEAMAMGKPTIASNLGALPEIITDGEDGLLVPPGDAAALADKIMLLLEDEGLSARLGEAARRKVEEKFDIETHVVKMERIYEQLLKS